MANILVIDDDKNILRLLEFALQRAGHTVTLCVDGLQGLAQAESQLPDLIVADVMMPKMTGYDFCKQVRAKPALQETPIIVFSARFQPVDKQTALNAGATDYLPKTMTPDALVERISELLPGAGPETITPTRLAIGLFSLKGGVGLTSLAVNLAIVLALTRKTPAALVDLTPLGGHAALMLGLRPATTLTNVLATANDNFTLDTIKPYFIQHNSGIRLLASPMAYNREFSLTHPRLEQLVTLLKSAFSFTILDLPHLIEPQFAPTLRHFDKVALVISPDMPALQSTALALRSLTQLDIPESKIALVVNQVFPQHALPLQTIQKAVKRPILAHIPFEPDMIRAANTGRPLLLSNPRTPAAAAIAKLANILAAG